LELQESDSEWTHTAHTEQNLRREWQKWEKECLAPPEHWTSSSASAGKVNLVKVRDDGVKNDLQKLLHGTGIGSGGRDQQQPGAFPLRSSCAPVLHH